MKQGRRFLAALFNGYQGKEIMDEYNVVNFFKSDICMEETETDRSAAIEDLRQKVNRMHARYALTRLLRLVVFTGLLVLGMDVVESPWGDALAITAGIFLMYTVLFSIRGHWSISRYRKARLYWLQSGGKQGR